MPTINYIAQKYCIASPEKTAVCPYGALTWHGRVQASNEQILSSYSTVIVNFLELACSPTLIYNAIGIE